MATFFGEITDLDSRAVWYSDEEDDDDEDLLDSDSPAKSTDHESIRSRLSIHYERFLSIPKSGLKDCIISLVSSAQYKNFKTTDTVILMGQYKNLAKVFLYSSAHKASPSVMHTEPQNTLWLMFDQSASMVRGIERSYLVEAIREQLYNELELSPSCPVYILSKQYSNDAQLNYLSNLAISTSDAKLHLPFTSGSSTKPPLIVRNTFESAFFEQLTLTHKLAYVVFLPDPRNHWFDKALCWPGAPEVLIELRLCDDNLDKTLIFT